MIRKWNQTNYKNNEPCLCQNVDFMQSFNKHTDTYKMKTWNNFIMLWFFFLNVACAVHRFRTFFLGPHSPQTYHFRRDSNPQFVKGLKIEQNWELIPVIRLCIKKNIHDFFIPNRIELTDMHVIWLNGIKPHAYLPDKYTKSHILWNLLFFCFFWGGGRGVLSF